MRQLAIIFVILAAAFSAAAQTEEPTPAPFVYSSEPAELKFIADTDAAIAAQRSEQPAQVAEVPVFGPNGKLVDEQPKKLSRWQRFNLALSSALVDGLSGASYRPYSYRPYLYRSYGYRPVHVRSYIRRDGTYVRSHSRRSPR